MNDLREVERLRHQLAEVKAELERSDLYYGERVRAVLAMLAKEQCHDRR